MPNFMDRITLFVDALHSYWKSESNGLLKAEEFFQKMVTFGFAPSPAFIEEVSKAVYSNRQRPHNISVSPKKNGNGS